MPQGKRDYDRCLDMLALYLSGNTYTQIGKQYKIHKKTARGNVENALKRIYASFNQEQPHVQQ